MWVKSDATGRILEASEGWSRVCGYPLEELNNQVHTFSGTIQLAASRDDEASRKSLQSLSALLRDERYRHKKHFNALPESARTFSHVLNFTISAAAFRHSFIVRALDTGSAAPTGLTGGMPLGGSKP